jgi:hypothetical protein
MQQILIHLRRHRELYLFPALALFLIWAAILFVERLTGRAVIDDPGVIIGYLYNYTGAVLLCALVGQVQSHLFGFRAQNSARATQQPPIKDDLYDACITLMLLAGFGYLFFFR